MISLNILFGVLMVTLILKPLSCIPLQRRFKPCRLASIRLNYVYKGKWNTLNNDNTNESTVVEWLTSFCESFYLQGTAQKDYLKHANRKYQLLNKGQRMPNSVYEELKQTLNPNILSPCNQTTIQTVVFPSRIDNKLQNNDFFNYQSAASISNDVVIMDEYLSTLSTPEQRLECIKKSRSALISPGCYADLPHRSGLLIIIERSQEFDATSLDFISKAAVHAHNTTISNSKSATSASSVPAAARPVQGHDLLNDWRNAIKKCGFEIVKQRYLYVPIFPIKPVTETSLLSLPLTTSTTSSATTSAAISAVAATDSADSNDTIISNSVKMQVLVFKTTNEPYISTRSNMNYKLHLAKDFQTHTSSSLSSKLKISSTKPDKDDDDKTITQKVDKRMKDRMRKSLSLPVGIVGGGLGGVALALALQRRNIPVKVFEKDPTFAYRKQGYALTIQQGAIALRALNVMEEVSARGCLSLAHISLRSTGDVIGAYGVSAAAAAAAAAAGGSSASGSSENDSNNESTSSKQTKQITNFRLLSAEDYAHMKGKGLVSNKELSLNRDPLKRHNIHIPRQVLREIILNKLNPDIIHWNKKLISFKQEWKADEDRPYNLDCHCNSAGQTITAAAAAVAAVAAAAAAAVLNVDSATSADIEVDDCRGICSSSRDDYVNLEFEDGSVEQVSILVAADGIHSPIRKQLDAQAQLTQTHHEQSIMSDKLSHTKLNYLGLIVILGISNRVLICDDMSMSVSKSRAATMTEVKQKPRLSGRYQVQWVDGVTRVFTMPYDEENTMWQLSFPMMEDKALQVMNQPELLKSLALDRLAGWHKPLFDMIETSSEQLISGHPAYDRDPINEAASDDIFPNNVCTHPMLQDRYSDTCMSRVTLLGDAGHPMSPFKGQGANQALLDSLSLSKALVFSELIDESRRPVTEALREYETEMWMRSRSKVLKSRTAAALLHSDLALVEGNITRAAAAENAFSKVEDS